MKTWFITGTSRGFGRQWAIAALDRGDHVAATARDLATLDELVAKYGDAILPIKLDVTDREAAFAAVRQAHDRFGRLDVVVNNAGYGHFGMIEEVSEGEIRAQLETNVLGALWVTQAALPYLRDQGRGHIIQVASRRSSAPVPTTPRSGRLRGSARACRRRSPGSASRSRWSNRPATPLTGPGRPPSTRRRCPPTTRCGTRLRARGRSGSPPRATR
jgi:NAD(P)-dependent dehydrogenase (short-subunit alcohol dehydrogenase family)